MTNRTSLLKMIADKRKELNEIIDELYLDEDCLAKTKILEVSVEFDELIVQYYNIENNPCYSGVCV